MEVCSTHPILHTFHPQVALQWVDVPLGSVRISLGYMSTFEDVWAFSDFVEKRYKDRQQ